MLVEIQGLREHDNSVYNFEEGSVTLLRGENGVGKSTLLQAIKWCITKKSYKLYESKCMVRITFRTNKKGLKGFMIQRETNPGYLLVRDQDGNEYEGDVAQALINRHFGVADTFDATAYLVQKRPSALIDGLNADRVRILNLLTFPDAQNINNPDIWLGMIDQELKTTQDSTLIANSHCETLETEKEEILSKISSDWRVKEAGLFLMSQEQLLSERSTSEEKIREHHSAMDRISRELQSIQDSLARRKQLENSLGISELSLDKDREQCMATVKKYEHVSGDLDADISVASERKSPKSSSGSELVSEPPLSRAEGVTSEEDELESLKRFIEKLENHRQGLNTEITSLYSQVAEETKREQSQTGLVDDLNRTSRDIATVQRSMDVVNSSTLSEKLKERNNVRVTDKMVWETQVAEKKRTLLQNMAKTAGVDYTADAIAAKKKAITDELSALSDRTSQVDICLSIQRDQGISQQTEMQIQASRKKVLSLVDVVSRASTNVHVHTEGSGRAEKSSPGYIETEILKLSGLIGEDDLDEAESVIKGLKGYINAAKDVKACPACKSGLRIVGNNIEKAEGDALTDYKKTLLTITSVEVPLKALKSLQATANNSLVRLKQVTKLVSDEKLLTLSESDLQVEKKLAGTKIEALKTLKSSIDPLVYCDYISPSSSRLLSIKKVQDAQETIDTYKLQYLKEAKTNEELLQAMKDIEKDLQRTFDELLETRAEINKSLDALNSTIIAKKKGIALFEEEVKQVKDFRASMESIRDIKRSIQSLPTSSYTADDVVAHEHAIESLTERKNVIERLLEVVKVKTKIEEWKKKLIESNKKYTNLGKLRKYSVDVQTDLIQITIDRINAAVSDIMHSIFPSNFSMKLTPFKDVKSTGSTKNYINVQVSKHNGNPRDASTASGGEEERVSFALTLALNATSPSPILMLDESLSGVPTRDKIEAIQVLRTFLLTRGKTIIMASHGEIEGFYDQIITLKEKVHVPDGLSDGNTDVVSPASEKKEPKKKGSEHPIKDTNPPKAKKTVVKKVKTNAGNTEESLKMEVEKDK